MFEVTGDDIKELDDEQLRTLISRLSIAELRNAGQPISGVTAGGDQNSPDGGIDVRVETHTNDFEGDFIPKVPVGFQVKKPDMGPAAIKEEMSPKGVLRPVIEKLADDGGAYIIVSAQGTTSETFLEQRRQAIRSELDGIPSKDKLHTEFYDRVRIANWANKYPGATAWVREKVGKASAGWESIGSWINTQVSHDDSFLIDDEATVVDARTQSQQPHSILEGLQVIREELRKPRTCIRLIGLSGVGKTRFVKALFENAVGDDPLDPSLTVYTDYSEEPTPTAKQLAQSLVERGERAILVIDNCNPQTHSDLAEICDNEAANISLLTIEYDVRGDEPERTDVFRLSSASENTIVEWLKINFDHISQVDRYRISEFSGGNFRVARVLAETLKKGDTLAKLTDSQLFERIFQQRHDSDGKLLKSAEILSLIYSYNGEATDPDSELAILGKLADTDADSMFETSVYLQQREVVQSRGRWRALLPQAIANRLAANAIERISPARLSSFIAELSPRLAKSFTRRLGYLHDNNKVKELVKHLLQADGPLGDLFNLSDDGLEMLKNIAPVAPDAVLARILETLDQKGGETLLNPKLRDRWQIVTLLRALAYDADLFETAARLISRFVLAEDPNQNQDSAVDSFEGLFHLYLSGTMALPESRRALVKELSENPKTRRAGLLGLQALLHGGHFSSSASFDFGARSRDYGWEPATFGDQWQWYAEALNLARTLCQIEAIRTEIAPIVASSMREFLTNEPSLEQLEAFAEFMLESGPWTDGWRELKLAIKFDQDGWPDEIRDRVNALLLLLSPSDTASEIQAWILSGNGIHDLVMSEASDDSSSYDARLRSAEDKARKLGREATQDHESLIALLPELFAVEYSQQVYHFGCGLAESCPDRKALWQALLDRFEQLDPDKRNAMLLGGYISEAHARGDVLASQVLDECLVRASLQPYLFYFQGLVGYDDIGIERIWTGMDNETVAAAQCSRLANGAVRNFPEQHLPKLLRRTAALEGGVPIALDIFHMAVYSAKSDKLSVSEELLQSGRDILPLSDFRRDGDLREYAVKECVKYCYEDGQSDDQLKTLAESVKSQIGEKSYRAWEFENIMSAIFEANSDIALDVFVLNGENEGDPIFGLSSSMHGSPIQDIEPTKLWQWADQDAAHRYAILGRALKPFPQRIGDAELELSPTYLEALERSPDRSEFLNAGSGRLSPSGWSGSLASILDRRCEEIKKLTTHQDEAVRGWSVKQCTHLKNWADNERERETEREESFE